MNILAPLLCVFLPGLPDEGPDCTARTPTVRQMVDDGYVVVLAKYASVEEPIPHQTIGRTRYEVVEIIHDTQKTLAGKSELHVDRYLRGEPGELYLLYGSPAYTNYWHRPVPVSKSSFGYIKEVVARNIVESKWLEFFVGYLEDPDRFINQDAYRECEQFSLEEFQGISSKLPRDKLREWIKNDKFGCRHGLYSLMLGLCGDDSDAALLAGLIKNPVNKDCDGGEGVMCGYLLLKEEKGLDLLEAKLKAGMKAGSAEPFMVIRALQFAWVNTDISRDRLKKSMRLALDHPKLVYHGIHYLTQWKDWDAQDTLMAIYDRPGFRDLNIKGPIIKYMLTCSKDTAENADQNPVEEHAMTAKKHLGTLRRMDPQIYDQTERYFLYQMKNH